MGFSPSAEIPLTKSKEINKDKFTNYPVELNEKSYQARIGLARILVRKGEIDESTEIESLYREVINISPHLHDSYIELGELLVKTKPMDAVDVYTQFPFSAELSYDDGYLYGEIVRILFKCEVYDDPRIEGNMISLGRILGFSALEKYITILENKYKYNKLLCRVYAGVNNKSIDNPDIQAFFKFKLWV